MAILIVCALIILYFSDFEYLPGEPEPVFDKRARILCGRPGGEKFGYVNIKDCGTALRYFGINSSCDEACAGLLSCVRACPNNAIGPGLEVDPGKCTACGNCVSACPQGLILLEDVSREVYIKCVSSLGPQETADVCGSGCTRCYICMDACNYRAIYIDEKGFPRIDYSLCTYCSNCLRKCPSKAIARIRNPGVFAQNDQT
ncbi:MAG: 4Fe-4S binding protein [Elusimicrobia bacterium]|nr:4Fe-4S binding protein [Elusimicrobiota bacterium]